MIGLKLVNIALQDEKCYNCSMFIAHIYLWLQYLLIAPLFALSVFFIFFVLIGVFVLYRSVPHSEMFLGVVIFFLCPFALVFSLRGTRKLAFKKRPTWYEIISMIFYPLIVLCAGSLFFRPFQLILEMLWGFFHNKP